MTLKKIGKKLGMVGASLVLMTAQMTPFFVFGGSASATPSGDVTICHATSSHTNPYTVNTVNQSSVDEINNQFLNGHGDHTGVVWYPGVADQSWGDIIPPFTNTETGTSYPGMNWTTEGQAIWNNDCEYPVEEPDTGSIKIEKNAIPDSDQAFRFTTQGLSTDSSGFQLVDDTVTGLPNQVFNDLPAGEYTITETGESGWNFDGIVCSAGSSVVKNNASVTITLSAGEDVTCTFTNREVEVEEDPTVIVTKFVNNNYSGEKIANQFPVRLDGDLLTPGSVVVPTSTGSYSTYETVTVEAGVEFVISEDATEGYKLRNITCKVGSTNLTKPFIAKAGEEVKCNVVNEDLPDPTVTVTKFVNYENGGNKPANEFPVRLNGDLLTPGDLVTPPNGNTYSTFKTEIVEAGVEFVISEDATEGYKLRNITCKVGSTNLTKPFIAKAGEEVKCDVVNVDLPKPQIVASKLVCSDEALLPNWGAGGPDITALTAIEYADKYDGCELEEGWIFEYAFNNTKNPGDNKEVGGTGWTPFGPTDSNGEASTEISDVEKVNRIWIREQLKTGYLGFTFNKENKTNVDSISAELYCNNDVLNYDNYDYIKNPQYDTTYYCVAWNVELGRISAVKYNDRNGDGKRDNSTEEKMNDWEITVYDSNGKVVETAKTGRDGKGKVIFTDLLPGEYKVCEKLQSGWVNTQPSTEEPCYEVKVRSGRTKSVKFGNTNYAKVTVTKKVINDNSGEAEPNDFSLTVNGEVVKSGETNFINPDKGLTIDETQLEGYQFVSIYGDYQCPYYLGGTMKLKAGDDVNCTVVNDDIPNPSINVVKEGPSTAAAGSEVTYTFTVTNTGDVALSDITVEDSITGEGVYVSGDTNKDDYLDLDETWIYEGKYTIPTDQVADVENTVEACGFELMYQDDIEFNVVSFISDEGQNGYEEQDPVCDTDDHSLSIPQVLGETTPAETVTPPAVLATTGEGTSAMTTGALLIAAALLTGFKRRTVKVPAR